MNHEFMIDGLRIVGGFAKLQTPKATVILCHGLPSGTARDPHDQGYEGLAATCAQHGYEAWWFNFRGAYGSEGHFTLGGWMNDLHGVIEQVQAEGLPLYVVGSSAGGAIALGVAAENTRVDGVATLASPAYWRKERPGFPDGVLGMARSLGLVPLGFAQGQRQSDAWWAEFETNRAEWAVALMGGRPLLLVHGTADEAVPIMDAEKLFAAAGEPKELVKIPGAGHQLRLDPRAVTAVMDWLDRSVARAPVRLADDGTTS